MTLIMWKPEEPSREWDCFLWILFLQKRKPEPEFPADFWNSRESFRHFPAQNWRVTRSIWEKLCLKAKPDTVYPLKIRCQESVRKTVHTVKMSAEPMSMEFLTGKMWQRLLYVFWVRKRESMYLR